MNTYKGLNVKKTLDGNQLNGVWVKKILMWQPQFQRERLIFVFS
jgi:hypothetical protein